MITKKEINEVVELITEKSGESPCYAITELHYYQKDLTPEELMGLKFEWQDSFGGEGKGDHCHVVYKVTRGDESVFIKFDGYYSSYDGRDFNDGFYFCEPYEKTVRDWRKVNDHSSTY